MAGGERPQPGPQADIVRPHEIEPQQKFALLSVTDKTGIEKFASELVDLGYSIISTGGTAEKLKAANISVIPIEEVTGTPEGFDGRVKTLSSQVSAGILYIRDNPEHIKQAQERNVPSIDLVVVNLYPFEKTAARPDVTLQELIENIDIGGPTMQRAASKNYKHVLSVTDPKDYDIIIESLESGKTDEEFRLQLAARTFQGTAFYDAQIGEKLSTEKFPHHKVIPGRVELQLKYGENPHQEAAVYFEPNTNSPLSKLIRHTDREPGAVNYLDMDAGITSVRMFKEPAAVIIKHGTPCGIALGENITEALMRAIEGDPVSAFGGVIVTNTAIDIETAKQFAQFKQDHGILIDVVAAPEIPDEAIALITATRKDSVGVYTFGDIPEKRSSKMQIKPIDGGFVLQDRDDDPESSFPNWQVVTERHPNQRELQQMKFAWKILGGIRSNSVVVVDREIPMTRGIGTGQTSRFGAAEIALHQARGFSFEAIAASDAFFPQDDCLDAFSRYGIKAVVQPGGALKDQKSIDIANRAGITMVFTGQRRFSH